jgi:hypothetical protein
MSLAMLLALALQALPAPDSVQWEPLTVDQDGRNSIDPASISREGDLARFTLRVDFHDPASHGGVRVAMSLMRMDCRRRTLGIQAADAYGEDGRLIQSRAVEPAEIAYTPLASWARHERIRARVCGGETG